MKRKKFKIEAKKFSFLCTFNNKATYICLSRGNPFYEYLDSIPKDTRWACCIGRSLHWLLAVRNIPTGKMRNLTFGNQETVNTSTADVWQATLCVGGRRGHTQNHWGTSPKPSITLIPRTKENWSGVFRKSRLLGDIAKPSITLIPRTKENQSRVFRTSRLLGDIPNHQLRLYQELKRIEEY